ncbi:hypothetical protein BD779DRAFT_1785648 [Infundibulicybe gibba]|nr:hypothetical protein BD779DRAFT_1785648 [Infundibulicybe gibba]
MELRATGFGDVKREIGIVDGEGGIGNGSTWRSAFALTMLALLREAHIKDGLRYSNIDTAINNAKLDETPSAEFLRIDEATVQRLQVGIAASGGLVIAAFLGPFLRASLAEAWRWVGAFSLPSVYVSTGGSLGERGVSWMLDGCNSTGARRRRFRVRLYIRHCGWSVIYVGRARWYWYPEPQSPIATWAPFLRRASKTLRGFDTRPIVKNTNIPTRDMDVVYRSVLDSPSMVMGYLSGMVYVVHPSWYAITSIEKLARLDIDGNPNRDSLSVFLHQSSRASTYRFRMEHRQILSQNLGPAITEFQASYHPSWQRTLDCMDTPEAQYFIDVERVARRVDALQDGGPVGFATE